MQKKYLGLVILCALLAVQGIKSYYSAQQPSEHHSAQRSAATESSTVTAIDQLTQAPAVAAYLHQHQRLPEFYLTKQQARRQGWDPAKGNLCQVLPGRAIGGDHFANREARLPTAKGRRWYEADVNYSCGRRNSDRLLFSSDGEVYLTTDHYRSFRRIP